ncbi:MAG: amidohydrolase family protein [Bacteroidetes bacterium]|nr:amidohydrolase family protein [Bacteroidota bacterium]
MKNYIAIILTFLLIQNSYPQKSDSAQNKSAKWDVSIPHGPNKTIEFDTDEGTWISVDVSSDGKNILFDLLGDIYLMPITGGSAKLLSGGNSYETQPRFNPKGNKISYISDKDGVENIWIMDSDGANQKQLTKEKERQLNNVTWSPDGNYLVARKHYRNTRSLGSGEVWLYNIFGGDGSQITKRRNWEQDAGEPCYSPDGKYLYYSEDVSSGPGFQYNRDPYGVIYAIKRINLENGKIEVVAGREGGSVRPQISHNGKFLSFVRRVGLKSALFVQDLSTGIEKQIYDNLNRDQQEGWAIFGLHPNYSWTPDDKSIIISAKGKIWKINIENGNAENIPFNAHIKQTIVEALHFKQNVSPENLDVKVLRWVKVLPNKKQVIYSALGKLYIKEIQNSSVKRITNDNSNFEFFPSASNDGKYITYTTWNDDEKGMLWINTIDGKNPKKLLTEPGHYVEPSFSRDGKKIVFRKVGGDMLRGTSFARETGIYIVSSDGGKPQLVSEDGSSPLFNSLGDRIYLKSYDQDKLSLISFDLYGTKKQVHFISENAQEITPSPDDEYLSFVERFNVYVSPFPRTGQAINMNMNSNEYPVKKVSTESGYNLQWSNDNNNLYWSLGANLFTKNIQNVFTDTSKNNLIINSIGFSTKTDVPNYIIAITGATIISMNKNEVIQSGTILIEKNKITSIGKSDEIEIPKSAKIINANGKFIIPGMIDAHAHLGHGSNGILPQQNWGHFANLAYGVTTTHDPSNGTEMVFTASEMQKAGLITGPRIFSTGTILYGAEGSFKAVVNNLEDAESHLKRLKAFGAFSVKSYNQPRRDQRQQIIEAARKLEMLVVPEGGATFFWNMTHILDGHTGIEHSISISPLYKDVLTLYENSKSGYTPTLLVSYGGLSGEYYWFQHSEVWKNKKLLNFFPENLINSRSRRRTMVAEDDFNHIENSKVCKDLVDRNVSVQIGGHGQLQGLGPHWELWSLAQGGMTNHQALQCATINGAKYLGLDNDLGSLEKGKLADLIILEKNPLENIQNTNTITHVMLNGRLYDGNTLIEVDSKKERKKFYFETEGVSSGIEVSVGAECNH